MLHINKYCNIWIHIIACQQILLYINTYCCISIHSFDYTAAHIFIHEKWKPKLNHNSIALFHMLIVWRRPSFYSGRTIYRSFSSVQWPIEWDIILLYPLGSRKKRVVEEEFSSFSKAKDALLAQLCWSFVYFLYFMAEKIGCSTKK